MIYLDHAATSFPKPIEVAQAVARWFSEVGVSADRGDSDLCRVAADEVQRVRRDLAALCGTLPQRTLFTSGATEAVNLFLRGFLAPGSRVVTTAAEHSAVARTLAALADERQISTEVVAVDDVGQVDPQDVEHALDQASTALLVVNHASNVTGAVQDLAALAEAARRRGIVSLADVSQTLGLLPVAGLADVLVGSAHKNLLGPPGLGVLAVARHVPLRPAKQGGTGSSRALARQPEDWPGGFEPGTPNTPAIFGLGASLRWLAERDHGSLLATELAGIEALAMALREALGNRVRVIEPRATPRLPICSFTLTHIDPAEAGILLAEAGIHVRTGFHCAPWIHQHLGTAERGTIRVSVGPFATPEQTLEVVRVLAR